MKYDNMRLICLDQDGHDRTCDYWYLVHTFGATSHTAFRTRDAVLMWLRALGLHVDEEIPLDHVHKSMEIIGSYTRELVGCGEDTWSRRIGGIPCAVLSNGSYCTGKLDEVNGERILHVPNPNVPWLDKLDYRMCQKMKDEGMLVL